MKLDKVWFETRIKGLEDADPKSSDVAYYLKGAMDTLTEIRDMIEEGLFENI